MTAIHIYKIPQVSCERARSWQRERVDLRHARAVGDAWFCWSIPRLILAGAQRAEASPNSAWLQDRGVRVVEIERGEV